MYTTATLISNYLQRTLTANETAFLTILLPAIDRWIDSKTNSTFDQVGETTRYFDGGGTTLDIDPATEITAVKSITNDSTLSDNYLYTANDEYRLSPVNETVKREIRRTGGHFPAGVENIAVTAKFSEYNGGIPEDIQLVATIIAAEILNQGKSASSGGNIASESLEGHSVTYDTSANAMDGFAENNSTVKGILEQRRELFV